jgi:hypothetical protein
LPYGFGGVLSTLAPDGQSWYHGGSIIAEKRMSRGLLLNTSYTWSKTIDIIENELNSSVLNPRRPKDAFNVASNKGLSGCTGRISLSHHGSMNCRITRAIRC